MTEKQQQIIALSGAVQALTLVNDLATTGKSSPELAEPVLQSLVNYNPNDVIDAYGGNIEKIQLGTSQLIKLLNNELNRDIAAYLLNIISIEMKLVNNASMLNNIRSSLQELSPTISQSTGLFDDESFDDDLTIGIDSNSANSNLENIAQRPSILDKNIISDFADIYKNTISTIEPRIIIKGDGQYLQNTDSANQIRALLLAALRGVAFFRHYGGTRVQLMLKRKVFIETAKLL